MENYDFLFPWLTWLDENYTLEGAKEFAKISLRQFGNREMMPLRIVYKGETVGGTGFNSFNWHTKKTEIGYWLAEKHNGRGIVTKCCRKLLEYAFTELELNRVVIKCQPENTKSRTIPENLVLFRRDSSGRAVFIAENSWILWFIRCSRKIGKI
jgi:ribosomal-protein-serine acetyltransferase